MMKPIWADTCVAAWLEAAEYLYGEPEQRSYNVIIEITDPLQMSDADQAVYRIVDRFLRHRNGLPLCTVANTIFPASYYRRYGAVGIYEQYPKDYPTLKQHPDIRWGTYAIRLLRRTDPQGNTIKPLEDLVRKLKAQLNRHGPMRAVYEINVVDPFLDLPIYDPGTDRRYCMGGPCLSHLSFKLTVDHKLLLTAFYRSHHYVQRALGNFIGLATLQHFVASESGIEVGPLTCLSSMAVLETISGKWGKCDVNALMQNCKAV